LINNSNIHDAQDLVRLPHFDWDKAKDFYYIAKLGSFSEASKFLNTSQSGLSRKIKILEDHLNFKVFTRLPHGLELTRKGEELFVIIERTFLDLKGLSYNSAVMTHNGGKRKIRVSTTHALASYVFCELIIEYNGKNPHLIFELLGDDQLIDVVFNDIDIAIRPIGNNIRDIPKIEGVEQEFLFSVQKKLYASKEYLNRYGEPKTVNDLKNHRIIAFGHPERHPYANINWILTLGMPNGALHEPIFTSNSVECMIEAAKKGMGIIGSYDNMKILQESNLINILPDVKDDIIEDYILYPDYLKKDEEIIKFKNFLRERLNKDYNP